MATIIQIDPAKLLLPTQRQSGPDPWKLQRQIASNGSSQAGMPAIWVDRDSTGVCRIINGVTRACRIAKLAPGVPVVVEVICREETFSDDGYRCRCDLKGAICRESFIARIAVTHKEILTNAPQLRFGQLLGMLTDQTDHPYTVNPVMDIEDAELLPAAYELRDAFHHRRQTTHNEDAKVPLAATI